MFITALVFQPSKYDSKWSFIQQSDSQIHFIDLYSVMSQACPIVIESLFYSMFSEWQMIQQLFGPRRFGNRVYAVMIWGHHNKSAFVGTSTCNWNFALIVKRIINSAILPKAWQLHCRALCRISERFNSWENSQGENKFSAIWASDGFRTGLLYILFPKTTLLNVAG